MNRPLLADLVEETFDRFEIGWVYTRLLAGVDEMFLVGGAVRDALRDPRQVPTDIDLMTSGNIDFVLDALLPLGAPRVNRHGNLRYFLESGRHVDVIHTRRFYGGTSHVADALRFFDASINALAVPLAGTELLDPLDGARHLAEGRVVLPPARWRPSDPFEDVHVTLRLIRLAERTGVRVENPHLAIEHRRSFDDVDWNDLERLNGFGRAEAELRFARVFGAPASDCGRAGAEHVALMRVPESDTC